MKIKYLLIIASLSLFSLVGFAAEAQESPSKTTTLHLQNTDTIVLKLDATSATKTAVVKPNEEGSTPQQDAVASDFLSWDSIGSQLYRWWLTHQTYWEGIGLYTLCLAAMLFFLISICARLIRKLLEDILLQRILRRWDPELTQLAGNAIGRPASLVVLAFGLKISALPITLSTPALIDDFILNRIFVAMIALAAAWCLYRLISVLDHFLLKLAARPDNNLDTLIVTVIRKTLQILVMIGSVLFIGQNILGLNITTLLAGAGVIGLAIAFAAQETIANFFGTLMLTLEKPFQLGDAIQLNNVEGVVENVGFRSTQVRAPNGALITVPNKMLASETITNISRRPAIKETFNLTLVYDTTSDQMRHALDILHEILDNQPCMDMATKAPIISFNSFKDWALNIQIIVWFHPADYRQFMAWYTETNLTILRRFNDAGLEFAFPTTTNINKFIPGSPKEY